MPDLVIVESPAKAKLIQKFLGKDFVVKASMGHVRDLPEKKTELSEEDRKLPFASLAVDVEHGFEPLYVVKDSKKKVLSELQSLAKKGITLWIATDEDREGEAIGYHLAYLLGFSKTVAKRIVFHEITKKAILDALEHPRELDEKMVDAQQARRILDRLVGYKLSPLIWTKIRYGLSAGRVQSVAVRLVVEKEREIENFKPDEFWKLKSVYKTPDFEAELAGQKIKSGKGMSEILSKLQGKEHQVEKIDQKDATSSPPPPFTTSTLQQEAARKLGFSVKQTMVLAQKLYEGNVKKKGFGGGFITYMRTDSVILSQQALAEIRETILKEYGQEYVLDNPRFYRGRKLAQEAHEAIRPTHMSLTPEQASAYLDGAELKLYVLVWKRAIACQMQAAKLKKTSVTIKAGDFEFMAQGQVIVFPGFLKATGPRFDTKEKILPKLEVGQILHLSDAVLTVPEEPGPEATEAAKKEYLEKTEAFKIEPKIHGLLPEQHFTKPPARYTEASLVKKLEALGIGRPSTYAPTISTIQTRGYVEKREDKKLYATDTAKVVTDFLVKHFSDILSYDFTARMEAELDEIAEGKRKWREMMKEFYDPFEKLLEQKKEDIKRDDVITEKTDIVCEKCKKPMEIKLGRYGKFLSCTGYPECKEARPLNADGTAGDPVKPVATGEKCPECGGELVSRKGRFGEFVGCSQYPKCKYIKKDEKKIGVKCVVCQKGEMVEKKTRRKRVFYGCNQYPACNAAFWDKPLQKTCPKCGEKQLMVLKKVPRKKEFREICPVCEKQEKEK